MCVAQIILAAFGGSLELRRRNKQHLLLTDCGGLLQICALAAASHFAHDLILADASSPAARRWVAVSHPLERTARTSNTLGQN